MKLLFIGLIFVSFNIFAHSGGTDSSGCHHDHKNGGYHCHNSDDVTKERKPASSDFKEVVTSETEDGSKYSKKKN
jgi:hypothetical protein